MYVKMAGDSGGCPGPGCPPSMRVPITLTHVQYVEGDFLGMLLAWFSLLPIFILVGFATLVLFRRDLHTIAFGVGVVINEGFNFVLKHIIKEPRPVSDVYTHSLFVEYGMPSSHAQFMAFFATYFTLFLFVRVRLSVGVYDYLWKALSAAASIFAALTTCVSRIYLSYHTMSQIVCGVGAGCVMAVLWFLLVHWIMTPIFPHICAWRISEFLLLKDMSQIPNYLWYEYTSVRLENRKRMRTKSS